MTRISAARSVLEATLPDGPSCEREQGLVEMARTLARAGFAARSSRYDRENRFPEENFRELHNAGLLALRVPRQHGGRGASQLAYAAVVLELAQADAATALCFTMHQTALTFIDHLAGDEQKARLFAGVVERGTRISALGSEPNASIFSGRPPSTLLERGAGGLRLRGRKAWCSLGGNADLGLVNATFDGNVVAVMVPLRAPGVRVHADWDTMAMRGTQSVSIDFDDVAVAEADVLLKPLNLFLELEYAVGLSAAYLGIAVGAYRAAREMAGRAMQRIVTSPLGHDHPDAGRLFSTIGEMKIALEPAWLMVQRAAQTGEVGSYERSWGLVEAKQFVGETAVRVVGQAMRVAGARGLARECGIEQMFRDVQAALVMAPKPDHAAYLAGRFELGVPPAGMNIEQLLRATSPDGREDTGHE